MKQKNLKQGGVIAGSVFVAFILVIPIAFSYEVFPGYGYLVDCVDSTFPCGDTICSGSSINPGIDEGAGDRCYNSFDDNCNNAANEWDADPSSGVDCFDQACAGKEGPAGKTCCMADSDCSAVNPGSCGEVSCNSQTHTCEIAPAADPLQKCQQYADENSLECAAIPSEGTCRAVSGFPYATYACDFKPVNQKCSIAASCGAENGRDCACDSATFKCSINRCDQATHEREKDPNSLVYCYSECQGLQYVDLTGEALDSKQCVFNELFNLNNHCSG